VTPAPWLRSTRLRARASPADDAGADPILEYEDTLMLLRPFPLLVAAGALLAAACGASEKPTEAAATPVAGSVYTVPDTTIDAVLEAAGVAGPYAHAVLSTKLMGTVIEVPVREGDRVPVGRVLVRLDARDIAAKRAQIEAGVAEAEAVHRDAATQAGRIRTLYADSAATRAQLDAAETGLSRADAALRQARAAVAELDALDAYAVVRAPFAGVVTQRFVDPGAFAAPGAPLVAIHDGTHLRVTVTAAPDAVRGLARGAAVRATVEGRVVAATVEGVVPAPVGNLYTVNAIVANGDGALLAGSAATLGLPQGRRRAVLVPAAALRREGDLVGVLVRGVAGDDLRWVRLGASLGDAVEVIAGLRPGEQIVVPPAPIGGR
jgi:RND family efflux transporter MFP subunit